MTTKVFLEQNRGWYSRYVEYNNRRIEDLRLQLWRMSESSGGWFGSRAMKAVLSGGATIKAKLGGRKATGTAGPTLGGGCGSSNHFVLARCSFILNESARAVGGARQNDRLLLPAVP
jgi:hypothetical protein